MSSEEFPKKLYARREFISAGQADAFVGYELPFEGAVEYVRRDVVERAERETLTKVEEEEATTMSDRVIIEGPLGPFRIPVSVHPRTREVCEQISRQVFDGEYDHPELPGPKDVVRVIDIGAGWGAFSVWARKKWPGAYIEAFEPHAEAADVFDENVHELGRDGVETFLHRAAVTTDPAPRINGCEDWGAYHLAPADDTCARPVAGVHPRRIWECDVLKVDAEGAEVEILGGYQHLRECRALLVEFHSLEKRARVREIAEAHGFRCVKEAPSEATFGVMVWVKA